MEYVGATGGFVFLAWIGDVPMGVVATILAFLLAGCLASVLFDQLSGLQELRDKPRKVIGVAQSSIIGMSIGAGSVWAHEYIHDVGLGIGISLAVVGGISTALIGTAWRQRWSERQLYREILLQGKIRSLTNP